MPNGKRFRNSPYLTLDIDISSKKRHYEPKLEKHLELAALAMRDAWNQRIPLSFALN